MVAGAADMGNAAMTGETRPDDPPYYDDDPCDWDEEDGDDFDCRLMPDGQCLLAGSEECDWDCPNRMSDRFVGSPAWRKKHEGKTR